MNTVPPGQKVILAEQAFLALAREWRDIAAKTGPDCALPEQADTAALACLLLAVEWGKQFTEAVNLQCEENERLADSRWTVCTVPSIARLEALVWRLCHSGTAGAPSLIAGIDDLLDAFTHPNSAVRLWTMKQGWMVRSWLSANAVPLLLKNVADTLGGVRLAMGLARGLCATNEELEAFIAGYEPPNGFTDQFSDRIKMFREEGFSLSQMQFGELESRCRRMIEQAVFGTTLSCGDGQP
jgi:hypothetical protein